MKKNYFYSALMAFLLSGGLSVQTAMAQVKVDGADAQFHMLQLMQRQKHDFTPAKVSQNLVAPGKLKKAPAAPDLSKEIPAATETVDTILLTRMEAYKGDQLMDTYSYLYDQYGYRKEEGLGLVGRPPKPQMRYNYVVGPFNYWTTRESFSSMGNDKWKMTAKTDRDINDKKQLVGVRYYRIVNGEPMVESEFAYDYEHPYYDEYEDFCIGATTLHRGFSEKGDLFYEQKFEWKEALQNYVMVSEQIYSYNNDNQHYLSSKVETEDKGDEFITRSYIEKYTRDGLYLDQENHVFSGNSWGGYEVHYDWEGKVSELRGDYVIVEKDVPEAGYCTYTEYTPDDTVMAPLRREIKKGIGKDDVPTRGQNYYWKAEQMSYDGVWETTSEKTGEWMSNTLLCIHVKTDSRDMSYYELYPVDEDMAEEINREVYYQPNSQTYVTISEKMETENDVRKAYTYLKFYNLKDQLVKMLVGIDEVQEGNDEFNATPTYFYEVMDNGELKPAQKFEMMVQDSYDYVASRDVYSFDQLGRPSSFESWITKQGEEVMTSKEVYVYDGKNFTVSSYDYILDEGFNPEKYDYSESKVEWPSNDVYVITYVEKDDRGDIVYGRRSRYTPDAIFYERYNSYKHEFEYDGGHARDLRSVDADGYVTEIYRKLDDNHKVVNVSKSITKRTENPMYEYSERHAWDETNNKWVPEYKYMRTLVDDNLNFVCKMGMTPMYYSDEGANLQTPEDLDESSLSEARRNSERYEWNPETNAWVLVRREWHTLLSHEGNTYVVEDERSDDAYVDLSTTKYVLNDDQYLVELVSDSKSGYVGEEPRVAHSEAYYTYNEWYYPTVEKTIIHDTMSGDRNSTTKYYYDKVSLIPTSISNVEGEELLKVTGREVIAPAGALIEVYDMGGRKVMSCEGQLTLPASGLYIVKSAGVAVKVSCK